jgi:hypothetical protein
MTYRQLARDEIIQLGREMEDLARWEGARDYVSALYGLESHSRNSPEPHLLTITVITVPGRQNYEETADIIVTDSANHVLTFDFSRYWWSQFALNPEEQTALLANTTGRLANLRPIRDGLIYSAVCDLCGDLLGINFHEQPRAQPPLTFTYVVNTPPSVSFPAVYIPE